MAPARRPNPERAAQSVLEQMNIRSVPVPVDRIAKGMGAVLRYSPLDDELSGMIYVKDGQPIIGINALHHPNRQRFSIAHEIGHLEMHRDLISEKIHVDKEFPIELRALKRDATSALGTETIEIEANRFAAALLVPDSFIEKALGSRRFDIDDDAPIEDLARQLRVSKQMLEYRIRNLPKT
ncbi:MAG: ImmA/IrrE family metallo-endopeptidase [Hyphomicrobiales bacterium]|nr:ImmA/IrrE family metallo-endopeptidase [Hyphomicrobiales bacterium]